MMAALLADSLLAASLTVRLAIGAISGAIVGSFLGVILARWPEGRSVVRGRSSCDACARPLSALDLVPILSFLALQGQCRACGTAIPPRHALMEIAAAGIGAASFAVHPGLAGFVTAMFGWWLLILGALDAEHHWLPDRLTLPLIGAGLAAALIPIGPVLLDRIAGAVTGFASLWLIGAAYRRVRGRVGLGGGDPKLLAGIGAWLGWQQLPLILVGAGIIGLASLALAHVCARPISATDRLPLGTLMAVAAWPIWLIATGS
jgi:leader peptidase (prepilin peptidase)/N-methyltransferase